MTDISKGRLMSGKTFTDTNYKRLKKSNDAYRKKLIDFDGIMCLIETNNIITGSNSILLKKIYVKPYVCKHLRYCLLMIVK